MHEFETSNGEIGHWVMHSRNGYRYMMFMCSLCKIWVVGPVFIEKDNVHFIETWPFEDAHEIVEIVAYWKKKLESIADIPMKKLCIHVQMVDLHLEPDWSYDGFVEYYRSGEPVGPKGILRGRYDALVISLMPDPDLPMKNLEWIIVHELVHAAFPSAGGKRHANSMKFFNSPTYEKWIEDKTDQLLVEYGYMTARKSQ